MHIFEQYHIDLMLSKAGDDVELLREDAQPNQMPLMDLNDTSSPPLQQPSSSSSTTTIILNHETINNNGNIDNNSNDDINNTQYESSAKARLSMDKLDAIIQGIISSNEERSIRSRNQKLANVLPKNIVLDLLNDAEKHFMALPMLLDLVSPLAIVGDIHGQLNDLIHLLQTIGLPPNKRYLFLGDYVDRGIHSVGTFCLLAALMLRNPNDFFLLRGNHECQAINRIYGFYDECKRNYDIKTWKVFSQVFDCMPVVATINHKIFCVHGGISLHLLNLDQINAIKRPCPVPDEGLLCDLLWSDPDPDVKGYAPNDRGVSYIFGYDAIQKFNKLHGFDLICRAHQVVEEGFDFHCNRQLLTIFSARDYCGDFTNDAAVLNVDENLFCVINRIQSKANSRRENIQ